MPWRKTHSARGAGNETMVASGRNLRTSGANMNPENVTLGRRLASDPINGAMRNMGGISQINN